MKTKIAVILFFGFWLVYFSLVWIRAISIDSVGNIFAGHVHVWGDWAIHFTMGSSMAFKDLIPDQSPILLGAKFQYPYFVNFVPALLIRAGIPFFAAFTVPSYLSSLLFILVLFLFYRTWFQSSGVAILGSTIFLFNGGLGFIAYFTDVLSSDAIFKTLFYPPRIYSAIESQSMVWRSVIDSMIIPQRAFQLGFPLGLVSLMIGISCLDQIRPPINLFPFSTRLGSASMGETQDSRRILWLAVAGFIWGVLPIIHTHSFVALSVIYLFWFVGDAVVSKSNFMINGLKYWIVLGGMAMVVAIPLVLMMDLLSKTGDGGMRWFIGWYAKEDHINWFLFWWRNWGITPILALIGAWSWIKNQPNVPRRQRAIYYCVPFVILFILINLVSFQPWLWDNTKILVWVSVAVSGLAGKFIFDGWTVPSKSRKPMVIP